MSISSTMLHTYRNIANKFKNKILYDISPTSNQERYRSANKESFWAANKESCWL